MVSEARLATVCLSVIWHEMGSMGRPATSPSIEFRALGTPLLTSEGVELQSVLARPKLLGLLSFLACSPPGFQRRDTLLVLFWAESDQKRARSALRQSLYYLRQSLGRDVLVARGDDEVGLDEGRLWCDVRAFEAALEEGRESDALELYRADLLMGFYVSGAPEYERWLDERRQALRRKASDAAWVLAQGGEAAGNAAGAAHWARAASTFEPTDERLLTQAVELLDRVGDRSGALHLYESFCLRLQDEFDIEPAPETRALVARIRGRQDPGGAVIDPEPATSRVTAPGEVVDTRQAVEATAARPTPDSKVSGGSDGRVGAPEPPREPGRRPARSGLRGVALGAILGVATVFMLYRLLGTGEIGADVDPQRVVVAVFDNQTGDDRLDPLGRMAADWITQALHESGVVEVVPSTIDMAPRPDFLDGQQPNITALARATRAGTVVVGAYYRRGDSVEIQAQVIEASHGDLLSALPPVGSPLDAPGIAVDSLSRNVVRTLAVLSDPGLARSADLRRPPSLEAYRQYLEGVRNFRRVPLRMREALPYLYRAVALDSGFLAPRFYLIMTHANLNEFALADSNAQLLEAKRPRLSESERTMLDWLTARLNGDQMAAFEAARARGGIDAGVEALAVNRPAETVDILSSVDPSPPYFQWLALMEAYHMLGDYRSELGEVRRGREAHPGRLRMLDAQLRALAALGRISSLERVLDEALLLPAEGVVTAGMVMANTVAELLAHGHDDVASTVAQRAIAWHLSRPGEEQSTWPSRYGLAVAYYHAERWEEAERLFGDLASEAPEDLEVMSHLGTLAARRADQAGALAISTRLEGSAERPNFGGDTYRRARIAAQLGDREGAVALMREALAQGLPFGIWLHRDIDLEPLHGDPGFEEFMRPKG